MTFVSSMEALIPGSRLRSEISILRGESAGFAGEEGILLEDKIG